MKLNKIPKIFYLISLIGVAVLTLTFLVGIIKLPAHQENKFSEKAVKKPVDYLDESPVDTSEMEVYINEKYGFEFKYPKIYEKFKGCGIREEDDAIFLGNRIQLQIIDSPNLALEEYINQYINQNLPSGLTSEYKSRKLLISGNEAIAITYRLTGTGRFGEIVFMLHNGKIYKFSFLAGPSCVKKILELETLHQIISSFKFIDKIDK